MNSKNWGYKEFVNDVKNTFEIIIAAHGFVLAKTDNFSFAKFKNEEIGIIVTYDDSKALQLTFRKYENMFDYEQFDLELCCLLKGLDFVKPVCDFKDEVCIKNSLKYIKEIITEHFSEELVGHFSYKEDYRLLKEENYFLKEKVLFLPLEDELKKKIKKDYLPNAGVKEMRKRLIDTNEYPERFKAIHDKYLRS